VLIRRAYHLLQSFRIDPRMAMAAFAGVPAYIGTELLSFAHSKAEEFKLTTNLCLGDRYATAGVKDWRYFYQDLTVAQRIFAARPQRDIDVGSRIDGL
jgi:hypothetical protein